MQLLGESAAGLSQRTYSTKSELRSTPHKLRDSGRKRPAEENGQPFAYWLKYTDQME